MANQPEPGGARHAGPNVGTSGPLGVMPVQSDHGDVHTLHVVRSNGDSLTVSDYRAAFLAITGRELEDHEIPWDWFAEEDRV